jgi:hypothetical protein
LLTNRSRRSESFHAQAITTVLYDRIEPSRSVRAHLIAPLTPFSKHRSQRSA